ncbi:uncharacterized protein LOC141599431 [Silene latifolia]|uniref:uncharacterized protein LOC141599431 n=1 Tax=Silene latifolia TaxID=37657 RepID=UPI003D77F50C
MDEPILYGRQFKLPLAYVNQFSLSRRSSVAFENDEKDEFMRLIKDPEFEEERHYYTADRIFGNDALEIGTAVFNGEIEGLIDELKDGMTPLHLAAKYGAPRLMNYFLQRGDKLDDAVSYATLIDLSTSTIIVNESFSVLNILWWVCYHNRQAMEAIRMLVRSKQNATLARQAFLEYARKGELHKLAALFLAVPELFLSSPKNESSWLSKLDLKLENKTPIEKQLSLLLDVFALVGHEFAAYIRLEEYVVKGTKEEIDQTRLEIDFFLREVARRKLGVTSPDYYLSFFEVCPDADHDDLPDDDDDLPDWDTFTSPLVGTQIFDVLPYFLTRMDVDRTHIYRRTPSLEHQDAVRLTRAIGKKLSSMSAFHGCLETSGKTSNISKKEDKHQPPRFPNISPKCFEPSVRSYHTSAGSANRVFDVKFTPTKRWENKVIHSTKLKDFFSFVKVSHFPLVAKRLLK